MGMKRYTIYDATGCILSFGEGRSLPQLQEGQAMLEGVHPDDISLDCVRDGKIVRKDNAAEIARELAFSQVRQKRNHLLAACDWTLLPDAPVDVSVWKAYRQALRDITDQADDPSKIVWPTPPDRGAPLAGVEE